MKILKLDADVVPASTDVFYNLNQVVARYGKKFYVQFKGRRIPFIVKRRLSKQKFIYKLSIAYTQKNNMIYPTLNMSIGDYDYAPENGYIDYVHRNDEHNLSGTFIVDLAIAFMKYLAVKQVSLADAAKANTNDENKRCTFDLAPYLLLKKNTTFYGKWGFKPELSIYNTSFENEKEKLKRLCKVVSRLQNIQVKDILLLLNKMKSILTKLKDLSKLITYNNYVDLETGVVSEEEYEDEWDTQQLNELLSKLDKLNEFISPYKKNTIHEMVQSCSCSEFKSLLVFGTYYTNMGIPNVIIVGKKKFVNKYATLFQEFRKILSFGSYVLDLTSKPSVSIC